MDADAVPDLLDEILGSDDPETQAVCMAGILIALNRPGAAPPALAPGAVSRLLMLAGDRDHCAFDPDAHVACKAVRVLGAFRAADPAVVRMLEQALLDPQAPACVRNHAARALADIGTDAARAALRAGEQAVSAWVARPGHEAFEVLLGILRRALAAPGASGPLAQAQALLHRGLDRELERLRAGGGAQRVNPDKYQEAERLFREALAADPGNEGAREGLEACAVMLEEIQPVQFMVPPDLAPEPRAGAEDLDRFRTPWALRRHLLEAIRERDRRAVEYTTAAFEDARSRAEGEAAAIVADAAAARERADRPAAEIRAAAEEALRALQERLDRGWKNHGPRILEAGRGALDARFGASSDAGNRSGGTG